MQASYKYGSEGRRVQKVTPTVTETCASDAFGKLAAEYFTAAPTSGGACYRATDRLGLHGLAGRMQHAR